MHVSSDTFTLNKSKRESWKKEPSHCDQLKHFKFNNIH